MEFLIEYRLLGLFIGVCTFLIIGLFHPVVVKAEYYWGTRCWWVFLLLGLGGMAVSLLTDNVHIQNTYEMITRLVEYDKPFELYVYPDRNHGMGPSRHHLMERCIEFVQRNL